MAKGYSKDLRERAVALVEDGESRREVARVLNLPPSTAVRWLDRWTSSTSGVDAAFMRIKFASEVVWKLYLK